MCVSGGGGGQKSTNLFLSSGLIRWGGVGKSISVPDTKNFEAGGQTQTTHLSYPVSGKFFKTTTSSVSLLCVSP